MGNTIPLLIFLALLCAYDGGTDAASPTTDFPITLSTAAKARNCTQREGTSFTVLMDAYFLYWGYSDYMKQVLDRLSARFPCVTRKYTSVILDYGETNETLSADKVKFMNSLQRTWNQTYYDHFWNCNQSLLYGLKRALQLSPPESVLHVLTAGSMTDYNNAQLRSDVFALLEEKKSQVYFLYYPWYCTMNPTQLQIIKNISLLSYGEIIFLPYIDYYQVMRSLELLLSKPINARRQALNIKPNTLGSYTEKLNITTPLTNLLITRDYRFTVNLTHPKGNTFAFNKYPYNYYYYYYYYNYYDYNYCSQYYSSMICQDLHAISSHLVKNLTSGTWTLNAFGNGSFSAQILGFAEPDPSGNCSDLACHPNATCKEFGGYGECTCKEGFTGNGYVCEDINECQNYYSSNCWWYGGGSCVNTIGSYTCNCYKGYQYDEQFGCFDIDECANSSLNDCHPLAECRNYYGSYTCTCPYGYYGDGKYCEVNECQQGNPCNYNFDCIKYRGSYFCMDPCSNHTVLNDPWRSMNNTNGYMYHCDSSLRGWYRFKGEYDQQIPERCVQAYSCGTYYPIWMNGRHPAVSDGIVNRTAFASYSGYCFGWSIDITVKTCPAGFYVYKLYGTPTCYMAYCTESNFSCSGISCAPDEECRVEGVPGCRCKNSSVVSNGLATLTGSGQPQVTCGLSNIQVSFSKCELEKLGYDTSSIYLKDNSCRGVTDRRDKSYITFVTKTRNGSCGATMWNAGSTIKYQNTIYLAFKSNGFIIRNEQPIDFYCSYPQNMEIHLLSAINPLTVSKSIEVNGTSNYTITMGLFQDSGYSVPYSGSEVRINSSATLYVGVIASGAYGPSPFVLNMKNCYATPTKDTNGIRHDIIINQCPNRNDPTVSVPENGVSLKSRFSIQMFKFVSSSQVYLHCQVGLCDSSSSDCTARCPSMRMADPISSDTTMTIGPINKQDVSVPSGAGGTASAVRLLLLPAIVLLVLLYQPND